jgi:hypothetical protein
MPARRGADVGRSPLASATCASCLCSALPSVPADEDAEDSEGEEGGGGRGGHSRFTVNGRPSTRREVQGLARSLGIHLDNLCSFLPQVGGKPPGSCRETAGKLRLRGALRAAADAACLVA